LVKPSDVIVIGTLAASGLAAAAIDLRTRRVPNALTISLAAAGLAVAPPGSAASPSPDRWRGSRLASA